MGEGGRAPVVKGGKKNKKRQIVKRTGNELTGENGIGVCAFSLLTHWDERGWI